MNFFGKYTRESWGVKKRRGKSGAKNLRREPFLLWSLMESLGVGPAVLFSGLNIGDINQSDSSADVALVVEAGLRFMALKNVSLDTSFHYRYARPSYGYEVGGTPVDIDVKDFNAFSFLFRASYHF